MITLSGCQLLPDDAQLKSYRVLVQQGNVINESKVDSLKINMTKEQVIFLLGEPVVNNIFSKNRWDYVYYKKRDPEITQLNVVSIFFEEENVISMKKIIKNDDGLFEINTNRKNDLPEFINDEEAIALKEEVFKKIELQGTEDNKLNSKDNINIDNEENIIKTEVKKEKEKEKSNQEINTGKIDSLDVKEVHQVKQNVLEKEIKKRKNDNDIIKELIIGWAESWKNKNLEKYFSYYSNEFTSSYFKSNESWKKDREKRILGKSKIEITVKDLSTEFFIDEDEKAIVKFQQNYTSNKYTDTVTKRITFIKKKDIWLIIAEDLIDGKY